MKIGEQTIIFLAVNKNGDEIILDNTPARQGEIWTDERSTHDEEYFSIEDHNSAIDPDQKKFCFKGYYYVEVKEQDDKELSGLMGRVVYE